MGILSIPIERMVGTWGLEPQTSTVSKPEFEVNRCTYKALFATKSPVGYGSSAYCDLIVTIPMPIVSVFHRELASRRAGRPRLNSAGTQVHQQDGVQLAASEDEHGTEQKQRS